MYSTSCLCLLFQKAVTTDRERVWGTRRCASSSGNDSLRPWHGVVLRPILHPKCLSRLLTSFHPEAVRQSYRHVLTELLRLCRPSSQLSPEDAEKSFQDTKLLTSVTLQLGSVPGSQLLLREKTGFQPAFSRPPPQGHTLLEGPAPRQYLLTSHVLGTFFFNPRLNRDPIICCPSSLELFLQNTHHSV